MAAALRPLILGAALRCLARSAMAATSRTTSRGGLVLAHALERGLAHQAVGGPAAEIRLDHQLRLHPAGIAAPLRRRNPVERRLGDLQRMQPLPQILRDRPRVAGADAPRIDEPAVVVIADHQRADGARQHGRRHVAADHEFLRVGAFRLDEGLGPAGRDKAHRRASTRCLRAPSRRPARSTSEPSVSKCSLQRIGPERLARRPASPRARRLRSISGSPVRSRPSRWSRSNT